MLHQHALFYVSMQTERQNKFFFLVLKLFVNKVNFQLQFIVNLLLVVCIVTLKVFYLFYKFGMVYTLVYRCFRIYSDCKKFHAELTFLKKIFHFLFPNFFLFLYVKQNTFSFVNTMPKFIHSNMNPIYTYTNTDVINMCMHIYICIYIYITA